MLTGDMINSQVLDEYKKRLLDILVEFDKFMKKHNIQYSLDGGTMLGAVRHKGFIPWDDDIDLIINKANYAKLLSFIEQFNSEKFEVVLPMTNDNSTARNIKIYDKTMTVKEYNCNCPEGAFIDIFTVMDCPFERKTLNKLYLGFYRFLTMAYDIRAGRTNPSQIKTMTAKLESLFAGICPLKLMKHIIKRYLKYNSNSNCICASSFGAYKEFRKDMFDSYTVIEFEGMQFPVIERHKDYLSLLYGDYMKLPPVEDRVSHHIEVLDFDTGYKDFR